MAGRPRGDLPSVPCLPRISPQKKLLVGSPGERPRPLAPPFGVWQRRQGTIMLGSTRWRKAPRMNQPLLRLLGFVVLAAIILATGFGAMGAAPLAVGGF